MHDIAHEMTDTEIEKLEKKIRAVYRQAGKEINEKMNAFLLDFKKKDKLWQAQVKSGLKTQAEYDDWKRRQIFRGNRWAEKKKDIAETLYNANTVATDILNGTTPKVYAINSDYIAYELETQAGVNFGFTAHSARFNVYDSALVGELIKTEPKGTQYVKMLPPPTVESLKRRVNKGKDIAWNSKLITRQVTQGIIQGESIDKIAERLAKVTSSSNFKDMTKYARTMVTSAQNTGREQRMKEAQAKGIELQKQWLATKDMRTRYTHAVLDGQIQDVDKPFRVEGYEIMYPADPTAHPSLVYNCRCTMRSVLKGYPRDYEPYSLMGIKAQDLTFEEWQELKRDIKRMEGKNARK